MGNLLNHKLTALVFLFCFLLVAGAVFWAYFSLRGGSTPLILYFNDREGITQIGELRSLLGAGAVGLAAITVNFILALEAERRTKFLSRIITAATAFLAALLFIGFAAIINVN